MSSLSQTLRRISRVRVRPDFERAYNTGLRLAGRYMTLFIVPNGGASMRLGVAVTRKTGPATERNRAKRLAREVFRRHRIAAGLDVIVLPRREMLHAPFTDLEADFTTLLEQRDRPRPRAPRAPRPSRRGRGARAASRV